MLVTMMEKEIKAYGCRKDTIIRFVKSDNAELGKVYVLYPNEYEEMASQIADLELKLAVEKSKNDDLKRELQSLSDVKGYDELMDRINAIENRLDKLESNMAK